MKIDELIKELKTIKEQYGNVEVITYNSAMESLSPLVKSVKFVANEKEERELFYDKSQMYDKDPTCVIVC